MKIPLEILDGPFSVRLERTDIDVSFFQDRTFAAFNVRRGLITRKQAHAACNAIAGIIGVTTPLPVRKIGSKSPY